MRRGISLLNHPLVKEGMKLRNFDISVLTRGNSRPMEAVLVYVDLDGFTKYVADNIDKKAVDVVRSFHVIRS